MKKRIAVIVALSILGCSLTGCDARESEKVSYNIALEAEEELR